MSAAFLASAVLALLLAGGCRRSADSPSPASVKVLLIGLDGASWDFIDPMLERGALPNLKRLIESGVRAPLKTLQPSLSVTVWTSIATGKSPARHGITGWDAVDPETGERFLASSATRKVEALWTMASGAGRRVGFVKWWATWPAEPVRGYLVSDQFARREKEDLADATYPRALAQELEREFAPDWPWLRQVLAEGKLKLLSDRAALSDPSAGGPAAASDRWKQAYFLYGHDHRAEQAAFRLLDTRSRPEIFGFLSGKIDVASHYMWSFLPEGERAPAAYSRLLEPVYAYEDRLVGRLLERSGPGVNLMIVSDHGFEESAEGYDHEEGKPDGIFIAWGPDFKEGISLPEVSLYDVTPTVLHLLGLPVARDMEGRVLEDALSLSRPIRWIASYETGRERRRATRSPLEERIRKELRALGYIQ